MTLDEALTYTPGSELSNPGALHLDPWEYHLSCLEIASHTDPAFTTFLCRFKQHETDFTQGQLPSEVNHFEMINSFIERHVDVQSQEEIEQALIVAVAYRDEGLINQTQIEQVAEFLRSIK
jgi:hypothetical protein